MKEAMEFLKITLDIDKYEKLEQNMTIIDQLGNISDKTANNTKAIADKQQAINETTDETGKKFIENVTLDDFALTDEWPMPTALEDGPGYLTMFYESVTGFIECIRVNIEESLAYKITRLHMDDMGVNVVTVSMSVIGVSIIHSMHGSGYTQVDTAVAYMAQRAYYNVFVYTEGIVDYIVVQSSFGLSLLYNKGGKAFVFVAGATANAAKDGLMYVVRKTADIGFQIAGMAIGAVGAIAIVYITSDNKKKRKRLK
jgi:uncharacterized membrane protein